LSHATARSICGSSVAPLTAAGITSSGVSFCPYRFPVRSASTAVVNTIIAPSGSVIVSFAVDRPAVGNPNERVRARPMNEMVTASPELAVTRLDRHDRAPEAGSRKPADRSWNSWEDCELVKMLDEHWRDQCPVEVKKDSLRHELMVCGIT
jgi:hypothetical protein